MTSAVLHKLHIITVHFITAHDHAIATQNIKSVENHLPLCYFIILQA